MDSQVINLIKEIKNLYMLLGVITIIGGLGGAFAAIKFGVAVNKQDIARHTKHFNELFATTTEQEARIAVLEDGIKGIRHTQDKQDSKLDEIRNLIIKNNVRSKA